VGDPLLTPDRLNQIRARWEENLPETATILPLTDTRDIGAVDDLTYPDPTDSGLVTMKCRWRPDGVGKNIAIDQTQSQVTGLLYCPVASRLSPTDRLYVTGTDASGASWAMTFTIVGPLGPCTWEAVRKVRVQAVNDVTNVTEEP